MLNQRCQNLKFSLSENVQSKDGILNQNPFIVTKTSAYNFQVIDKDKLKLAQLLAKRDIKELRRSTDQNISETEPQLKTAERSKERKEKTHKNIQKRVPCVSSISRVPGPATLKSSDNRTSRLRSKNIKANNSLPLRGFSPPVRDNCDIVAQPGFIQSSSSPSQLDQMQVQMSQCSNRLDQLQQLLEKNAVNKTQSYIPYPQLKKPSKSLNILTEKLQSLMESQLPCSEELCSIPNQNIQETSSNSLLLQRLDNLSYQMDSICDKWSNVGYEMASIDFESSDQMNNETSLLPNPAYTKHSRAKDSVRIQDSQPSKEPNKCVLSFPVTLVKKLDQSRQILDTNRVLSVGGDHRMIEWIAQDAIDEIVDDVLHELDVASAELTMGIINAEIGQNEGFGLIA